MADHNPRTPAPGLDAGTHNARAHHAPYFEALTPENAALLLIDHQAGLFLGVHSIDQQILKNNVLGLAKAARALELPTALFTSSAHGPNGPTIPELTALFPEVDVIDRSPINLWDDDASRGAVERMGRRKLVMAAITTDVCLAFPALHATRAGYDVYAVIDASGTWSAQAELATMFRLTQAGVICTNWVSAVAELKRDEGNRFTGPVNRVYGEHMGLYNFLGDVAAAHAGAP